MMTDLKAELYRHCVNYVQSRIDSISYTISSAQQSANEETKSSAGDKYETGRAMMQQEKDRNTIQLNEANKLMVALNTVGTNPSTIAETGSVVITDNGSFYIAISAGKLSVDEAEYFAVSPSSPVGLKMKGLKARDGFEVNGKKYRILEIQ